MQADRHTQRVNRRFENAEVILAMYAAGIDPFADEVPALREHDGYLHCGQRKDSIRWAVIWYLAF